MISSLYRYGKVCVAPEKSSRHQTKATLPRTHGQYKLDLIFFLLFWIYLFFDHFILYAMYHDHIHPQPLIASAPSPAIPPNRSTTCFLSAGFFYITPEFLYKYPTVQSLKEKNIHTEFYFRNGIFTQVLLVLVLKNKQTNIKKMSPSLKAVLNFKICKKL